MNKVERRMMNYKKLIDATTIRELKLNNLEVYKTETVKASNLLTPKRIDIVAKYMYLLFWQRNIKSNLAEDVYKKHIEIFSDGKFYEPDSETKTNFKAFISEFKAIYLSIKKDGFDSKKTLIPAGKDKVIINGAHRVASALYLDKTVSLLNIIDHDGPTYDLQYFKEGHMNNNYLDFLALNYIKLTKRNTFVVCLWPRAVSMGKVKEVEEIINKSTNIIYRKSLRLDRIALKRLMMHLYSNEGWVGKGKNNYVGTYGKVNPCYDKADTIFYFVEGKNINEILELKENIRALYKIGKHSVHITDTKEETNTAADLILNPNVELSLKYGYPDKLNIELEKIRKKHTNCKNKVLDPLYTLRFFGQSTDDITNTFYDTELLEKDVDYDINNFFFYRGFKFFSPLYAKEVCDDKYLKAFNSILSMNRIPIKSRIKENTTKSIYIVKRNTRYLLRRIGLLEVARKIISKKHGTD